jgi:glutamine synthetase
MAKLKLEYIWLDGYTPIASLRSKTKIIDGDPAKVTLADLPVWGFDGSSTQQAEGKSSDCLLKPVALYPDITRKNGFLVMSEVLLPNGEPHPTNSRATILDDPGAWFGFEQEYFFYKDGRPLGFPAAGYPAPQGPYYTGVGYKNVGDVARTIVEEHIDICVAAGINIEGINSEVAKGQWEFQIFGKGSKSAADQMWVARYIMARATEKYGIDKAYFEKLMAAFNEHRDEHIAVYGPDNHLRLTGLHETQSIDKFNYGVADRGASIRVPHSFVNNGYKGYLEDRRPNSAADPYLVASRILKTISLVPTS